MNPPPVSPERPTPETDAFVREYANADPARARDALTEKHRRLERQRDTLLAAVENLDPWPDVVIPSHAHHGAAYCEISVGEMLKLRHAIAAVKGEQP